MFSTTQIELTQRLVASMYNDGYVYYAAHTNTNLSNYSNYDFRDLTIYFSKSEFDFDDNYLDFNDEVIRYDVITRAVSNNSNDSKQSRFQITRFNELTVNVPVTEFIMTNAPGSMQMDCLAHVEYDNQKSLNHNLDLNMWLVVPVLLGVIIINDWLKIWFARNSGRKE